MSFTSVVKNEICGLDFSNTENIAELSGFIRGSCKYSNEFIELTTENAKVAKRIYMLIKSIYGIEVVLEQRKLANFSNKKIYVITIGSRVADILSDLSVADDTPKEYLFGSNEEVKAYLRGTFLNRGSVNDPKTSQYHLEFLYDNKFEAVAVQRLLNQFDMNSKIIIRDTKYMVYIKEAEKISDFLKVISAYQAVLYYENIRIYKEQKNNTNRLNNCEQANIDKIKEACEYRLKYPETSLTELSKIISLETNSNITKSGLNHRFRKIKEIASRLRKK